GVAIVLLVVLLVPAWWLRHAGEVFDELARLPTWLETNAKGPTFTVADRQALSDVRTGGALRAIRTVRMTVGELGDFLGPVTNAIEVAAPPFWIWTGSAVIAAFVLAIVGPVALLALAVF
ncbi:MAG: hypothetical protein M3Q68_01480, partial [Actinomycetota bacterium]|nr:hypothetical protein [Actinomycetota bacterium]